MSQTARRHAFMSAVNVSWVPLETTCATDFIHFSLRVFTDDEAQRFNGKLTRNGGKDPNTAYAGASNKYYYMTPEEFYSEWQLQSSCFQQAFFTVQGQALFATTIDFSGIQTHGTRCGCA